MLGDAEPPEIGADKPEPNRSGELRARRSELKEKLEANLDNKVRLKDIIIHLLPPEENAITPLNDLLTSTGESAEEATDIAWTIALEDAGLSPAQILSLLDRKNLALNFESQIDEPEEPKQE